MFFDTWRIAVVIVRDAAESWEHLPRMAHSMPQTGSRFTGI